MAICPYLQRYPYHNSLALLAVLTSHSTSHLFPIMDYLRQLSEQMNGHVSPIGYTETIISDVTRRFRERHFGVPLSNDGERPLGPLALFSFLVQTRVEKLPYREQHQHLRSTLRNHLQDGVLLETREKGGVYREVRSICPEGDILTIDTVLPQHVGYILLGFKSIDRNFSQVMVDSWKDWTGARYIYMYLPDELGLSRISFYTREAPDSLNMFMYLVLVECRGVTTRERQMKLLDFAQRMRVERMSGYISVYGISQE